MADPTQAEAVPDRLDAPWTVAQVVALNAFQRLGEFHPFTCPDRGPWHADINSRADVLVATIRGWVCPFCDYTQTWAHPFMAEALTPAPGSLDVEALRGAIYAVSVRHDWENTTDREDRTEEIAAEYDRLTPFEYGGALVNQRFASDVEPPEVRVAVVRDVPQREPGGLSPRQGAVTALGGPVHYPHCNDRCVHYLDGPLASDVEPSPDLDTRREWIASFEGTGWTPEDRQPDQGGVWLTRKNGDSLWVSAADSARLVNEVAAGLDEGGLHRALAAHMAAFMEQPESFENPDDVVASIAAHYAALVPAATSDVEPGPTGTWSKDVAWEAPGGNPTPPTSDVGPRADPFTERAEHERQSTAGTHLGDPHCPFCFFDHFDGETRANLYRASDVEPSPDLDVAERDTLRAVYEFWQGRPDLAPGIRLRERVRAALHTETSGDHYPGCPEDETCACAGRTVKPSGETPPSAVRVRLDDVLQSKIVFTFPDGTVGPGRWDPKTGTVVPDETSGEPR